MCMAAAIHYIQHHAKKSTIEVSVYLIDLQRLDPS